MHGGDCGRFVCVWLANEKAKCSSFSLLLARLERLFCVCFFLSSAGLVVVGC